MIEKEIAELRRRFRPDKSGVSHVRGCYVNESGEITVTIRTSPATGIYCSTITRRRYRSLADENGGELLTEATFKINPKPAASAQKPIDKLRSLMEKIEATDTEVQQVVSDKGHYPADTPITDYSDKFITGWLIKYWPQITQIICTNRMVEN
mgnify:CR=1 FL=1